MSDKSESDRKKLEAKILSASQDTYKRAPWKHVYRWLIFIFLLGLNIAMPMSLIERISKLRVILPMIELMQFGVLVLIDLYVLPVCLFEVNSVTVKDDKLIVSNLLWRANLAKKDIVDLKTPNWLASALLRTSRCFYLINKGDIPRSDDLIDLIRQRYL